MVSRNMRRQPDADYVPFNPSESGVDSNAAPDIDWRMGMRRTEYGIATEPVD